MAEDDFQEAVQTFMRITGASQVVAIRTLKEHHGDINDALIEFYNGSCSSRTEHSLDDVMDMFGHLPAEMHRLPSPSFPLAADLTHRGPRRTEESLDDIVDMFGNLPTEMRRTPSPSFPLAADLNSLSLRDDPDFPRKAIHGATGIASDLRKENKLTETKPGMVNMNDNKDFLSAPAFMDVLGHGNELEEEMMLAAIEASLQDSALPDQQYHINGFNIPSCRQRLSQQEISEVAKAVSLSLQTTETEKLIRGLGEDVQASAPKPMPPDAIQEQQPFLNRRRCKLETAGSPKGTGYGLSNLMIKNGARDIPTLLSPSHTVRSLAQLQNDSYPEGLEAEKEKEVINAWEKAALMEDRLKKEPDSVELFVRLPGGREIGRRFLKSDKLLCLFNFIDTNSAYKCGSYRLIWEWESLLEGDSNSSLRELDLNCQQGPLYLELI